MSSFALRKNVVWRLDHLTTKGITATQAAVLAEALISPDDFGHVRQAGRALQVINFLGSARDQAEVVVPALIEVVNQKVAHLGPREQRAAIDALGSLGPAAKRAVPALERWIFDEKAVNFGNGDQMEKHARRALRKIALSGAETRN